MQNDRSGHLLGAANLRMKQFSMYALVIFHVYIGSVGVLCGMHILVEHSYLFGYFFSEHLSIQLNVFVNCDINEPPHGKTNNLHMRKQRCRSASR